MKRFESLSPGRSGWDHAGFWLPALAFFGAGQARADDIQWGNVNGGDFNMGGNWIGGVVPGAGDLARFGRTRDPDQQAAYIVTFSASPSTLGIVVEDDRVTFDLNGNAYSISDFGIRIGTTAGGAGRLTLTDGIMFSAPDAPVLIGVLENVPGSLTISTGAQLLGPSVGVGHEGPGTLFVQNGGDIVGGPMLVGSLETGVGGAATITGAGSALVVEELRVGDIASGTVNITAGGRVESTPGTLGGFSAGIGTVNVDGVNSRWTSSGDLRIGGIGKGALNITGGGRVEDRAATAGNSQGSTGTVTIGGGSQWINHSNLEVGNEGQGSMSIGGGSLVQDTSGTIGNFDGTGVVTIDGAGSLWINSSDLAVGVGGDGTLNITAGGEVRSADGFIARVGHEGVATVDVSGAGSMWTMTSDLSVGGDIGEGIDGGSASLFIGAGGTVAAESLFIFPDDLVALQGGTLDVERISHAFDLTGQLAFESGTLHAENVQLSSLLNQGGTLAPGHSAGRTSIGGNYTQLAPATMEIELGGGAPGTEFDQIIVAGTAALGGSLNLRLINGFVPSPVQTFAILDAVGVIGAFANVGSGQRLVISGGPGSFVVHYGAGSPFDPTQVVLSDFADCVADFNGDGVTNLFDFLAFQTAFGNEDLAADLAPPFGVLNLFDFLAFQTAFGNGC